MKKTIFIVGGTGFIGEHTLHHLQSENDIEVLALAAKAGYINQI